MVTISCLKAFPETGTVLSDADRRDGFSLVTDERKNIVLLKNSSRVAWFAPAVDMETLAAMVKLVKTCG